MASIRHNGYSLEIAICKKGAIAAKTDREKAVRRILVLVMVLLTGCSPVNPRVSLEESRAKRREEFKVDAAKNPAIMAAWNLKENLKKDYREIIGPSAAHDEKMDLLFSNALNEAMLRTPGQYERMAESWAKTRSDPVPTREEIQGIIKTLDGRIKTLDGVIAKEMQLAESKQKRTLNREKKLFKLSLALRWLPSRSLGSRSKLPLPIARSMIRLRLGLM